MTWKIAAFLQKIAISTNVIEIPSKNLEMARNGVFHKNRGGPVEAWRGNGFVSLKENGFIFPFVLVQAHFRVFPVLWISD